MDTQEPIKYYNCEFGILKVQGNGHMLYDAESDEWEPLGRYKIVDFIHDASPITEERAKEIMNLDRRHALRKMETEEQQ